MRFVRIYVVLLPANLSTPAFFNNIFYSHCSFAPKPFPLSNTLSLITSAEVPWPAYVCTLLMGAVGMIIGYVIALAFKVDMASKLTIVFETGVQNASLAIAVITLSFKEVC